MGIKLRADPFPSAAEFEALRQAAWGTKSEEPLPRWEISLVHLGAYDADTLVGYVNVATDGGIHAFLLDPAVHPDYQRRGIGRDLVLRAIEVSRERGARWMHVDYEPALDAFYRACRFRPTAAGIIRL